LNADLLPKWRTRPAVEVTADDLLAVLNAKLRAGAPVAANRVRALVSRIYTFGAEQRLVPASANPVIGVKKPTKEATRDRVLTDDEIRRLWEACASQNPYVCAWFRLRLVTAQRGGELLQMRWSDIDPKSHFWTIPGEFVKNAHGHRVYLSATARALLKEVPRREHAIWVFPKTLMGISSTSGDVSPRATAPISWPRQNRPARRTRRRTSVGTICVARRRVLWRAVACRVLSSAGF
jgi:integrase